MVVVRLPFGFCPDVILFYACVCVSAGNTKNENTLEDGVLLPGCEEAACGPISSGHVLTFIPPSASRNALNLLS